VSGISGPNCTNSANACGNFIDQSGHGTHVSGTVAGTGPDAVAYANGIASGAKIFLQDTENFLDNTQCYEPDACQGNLGISTDLHDLFQPAFNAGARISTNSWGSRRNLYDSMAQNVDAFTSANPTFMVLFAAGNSGYDTDLGTVGTPGTCKNCLTVGASQQSDFLFRSMHPYVDGGSFCGSILNDTCCISPAGPRSCLDRCCEYTSVWNTSLDCCANPPSCVSTGSCSLESGNIRSATNVADFSSRGPTSDGRMKPDLVAPGEDILSAATPYQDNPNSFTYTSPNHCVVPSKTQARSPLDDFNKALQVFTGTSMATPLVAGAVEKLRQYFVQGYYPLGIPGTGLSFEPAEALVRAVVLASCQGVFTDPNWAVASTPSPTNIFPIYRSRLAPGLSPNFFQGFGLPILDHAVYMNGSTNGYLMHFTNATYDVSSNATAYNIECEPTQTSIPLTIALVWTDPPGSTNSQKHLVNDLDLIIVVRPPRLLSLYFCNNFTRYPQQILLRYLATCVLSLIKSIQ
jgi:serine protease AprX